MYKKRMPLISNSAQKNLKHYFYNNIAHEFIRGIKKATHKRNRFNGL